MTGYYWLDVLIGIGVALLITWLLFSSTLIWTTKGRMLHSSLRLLLTCCGYCAGLRLTSTKPGSPVRLILLLAYLAFPIDLVPGLHPGLGYTDDAIIVTLDPAQRCATTRRRRPAPPLAGHRGRLPSLVSGLTGLTDGRASASVIA